MNDKTENPYPWPNGCDASRPLTDPYKDANARCNHCKWFLNRCRPGGGCDPEGYAREDRSTWTR